jgi:ADP-dependent NAD(P)H-hydrate dehydratase / NAD(P)H-hydrate epimerase
MHAPVERHSLHVYRASQVRDLDRLATERHGVASYELMSRAAAAALRVLRSEWPHASTMLVYCGAGNNGGDGYVLARLAHEEGSAVRVVAVGAPERLKGDARRAYDECAAAGVAIERFVTGALSGTGRAPEVIVDALLGIGADRPLEGDFRAAVAAINSAARPVLALDVPSGLHADTGWPLGDAVRAAVTVTFVGLKQGLYLGAACDYTGRIELADLALPAELGRGLTPPLVRLGTDEIERALPRRPRSAHKGTSGRLLLVGGGPSMPGAIRLASEAALRTGAGLVYVAAHADSVAAVLAGRPEVIARAVGEAAEIEDLVASVDAVVLGPGLGRSVWASGLWRRLLATELPLIVDADGLNLLAAAPEKRGRWILTPHPGEAARLLGVSVEEVQRERADAARTLAGRFGAVVVLKGARSLVASPDADVPLRVCGRGNPGMATAGMGDVLAGVLGALAVQTRDLEQSARAGVLLHALAGDSAAAGAERGTLAADLMPHLRRWANPS